MLKKFRRGDRVGVWETDCGCVAIAGEFQHCSTHDPSVIGYQELFMRRAKLVRAAAEAHEQSERAEAWRRAMEGVRKQ